MGANLSWNWKMSPWPESGKMISSEPGMRLRRSSDMATGVAGSSAPTMTKVGAEMAPIRSGKSSVSMTPQQTA